MTILSSPSPTSRRASILAALALSAASIDAQAAAPETEAAPTVRLIVDASELGADASYFEGAIAEQLRDGLVAEGFAVLDQGQSTIRVRLDYFDERDRDFLVAADVVHQGRMAVSQRPAKCAACTDDEVLEAAVGMLPALIKALRADPQQVPMEDDSDPPRGDSAASAPPRAIGPLGISGGVVATLGLGAVIAGALAWSRGEVREPDPTALDSVGRDHITPGKLLVGVGAGALIVGAVMLGVDLGRRANQRNLSGRASIVPALGPNGAGLTIHGRF